MAPNTIEKIKKNTTMKRDEGIDSGGNCRNILRSQVSYILFVSKNINQNKY